MADNVYDEIMKFSNGTPAKATSRAQWIMGFPKGKFYFEKYGKDFDFSEAFFDKIGEAFDDESLSKPYIDNDHEFGKSFGDILDYEIRDDGMYFKIQLNADGIQAIKERQYMYISPAFGATTNTQAKKFNWKLMAISLTNIPAFEGAIPQLQAQIELTKEKTGGVLMLELAKLLEVEKPEESTMILAAQKLKEEITELSKKLADVEMEKAALSKTISEIQEAELKQQALTYVTEMVKLGKIHPAQVDFVLKRYITNPDEVTAEMNCIPEKKDKQLSGNPIEAISLVDEKTATMMQKYGFDPKAEEDVKIWLKNYKEAK
jgi:hypothetical protein